MKKNKYWNKALLIIACLLFSTAAFAIPPDPCLPKDVCCEEAAPGPFAFSYPKDVGLVCPRNFYVHGEYLLMKPTEEGLEYAMTTNPANWSAFPFAPQTNIFPLIKGKIRGFSRDSDEWDWRSGFRAGFGFYSDEDFWNISADWTYLKIKSDSEISTTEDTFLLPLFYPAIITQDGSNNELDPMFMTHASSRWSGDFNTLDIMIGKPYHVSRYFTSNPMFGIRAALIDQDYLIRYFQNDIFKRVVHLKNDYWGAGIRGYYEGQFLIGSHWYIFGKAAFSLLFGKFDISQQSENTYISQASPLNRIYEYKTEDSFYRVQPNAELALGFSWSRFCHKNQYLVSLKLAYEFHHWWDQNQARKFFDTDPVANDTVSRGDLSFNGFTFGLHCDF